MHQRYKALATIALALSVGAGCAQYQPLVSHAHVGHALTAWHDTPGQESLMAVAENQATLALEAARSALGDAQGDRAIHAAMRQTAIALNPALQWDRGHGRYGAIRAFQGALEHLEYASQADDASANLVKAVADLSAVSAPLLDRLTDAYEGARSAPKLSGLALIERATAVRDLLAHVVDGHDANGDGFKSLVAEEAGLSQVDQRLRIALSQETAPAYEPLPHKLLFGLVRLPDGSWQFSQPGQSVSERGY
jgi:hypothetical protein